MRDCLAFWSVLLALVSSAAGNSDWSLRVWQADDGLPNNNVTGLVQTPDGYLWVATPSCLARFDGVRFEEFPPASFAGPFQNQRIRLLLRPSGGGLCVGIDPGHLIFLDRGTVRILTNNLSQATIDSVIEDGEGCLWLSSRSGFILRIKDGGASQLGARENLPPGATCSLAVDRTGQVWFAKGNSVGVFRGGRFVTLQRLPRNGIRLTAARAGGIWICSGSQLFKYTEGGELQERGRIKEEMRGEATTILEDRTGAVWIGTIASGLFRYDGSSFESVPTSDREILCVTEDREGNVWIGTGGGGLNRVRPSFVMLESLESGAPFQAVQSLSEDEHGAVWATTQDGSLVCYQEGTWSAITNAELASAMLNCVASDQRGSVWIGSSDHRLFRWRDGQVTKWGGTQRVAGRQIRALLVSRSGDLWVGSEAPDALQFIRDGEVHDVKLPPGAHQLRTLIEDRTGNIWAAGQSGSLVRVTGDKVVDESAFGLQKTIRCFHLGSDDSLWMGFSAGGIGRIRNGRLTRVTPEQGLDFDGINQIVADDHGYIWLGTDHGIFRVRESALDAVANGAESRVRPMHYGRSEGVPGVQARFGSWPGALRRRDGDLWMPMRTALAVVRPERLHEDLEPPPVLLNRVIVDYQTVALYGGDVPAGEVIDLGKQGATLRLRPGHRRLEFEFAALSFGPPENIHFRYWLEGFDDTWRDAGNERSVSYSRLAAGDYRLHVTGCNSDGVWNEKAVMLALQVEPFLWQTWWFRSISVVVLVSVVVAIVRYVSFRRLRLRLRLLEQQAALDKERARIARDIHDDLGGNLTQVTLLLELALRNRVSPERVTDNVQQGLGMARQVIKSLDETVWAVNPRNDTLSDLINYLGQFAVDFLRTAGVRCRVKSPGPLARRAVSAEVRHNLFLAVKEALNNVARHAHATEASLRIEVTEEAVVIAIEDNGTGFDRASESACADGLHNMRKRMEEVGGQFNVESIPGQGTRIALIYPWTVPDAKPGFQALARTRQGLVRVFGRRNGSAKTNGEN